MFFILFTLFSPFPLFPLSFATEAQAAPARRNADFRREFASFVDGFFAGIQRDWQIPGMAFVAVRDGEILYKKGYGNPAIGSNAAVLPDETLFRVGSISKLLTATAIMQLVEKGRLAMDEDVNIYLRRWKLPATYPEPATIRHLLTHTAGFDGKEMEVSAPTSADERAFASRLGKIMPARYAPPGLYYSRSNMGYALLGSIVERYSRQSFASAMKKHIFQPLDMKKSTFNPSEDEMRHLAKGYTQSGREIPYTWHYDVPAVGMSSTANEIGRFMLSQLGEGRLGSRRTLSAMYANSMLRTHFTPHPRIQGTGLGYYEKHLFGIRTLQQTVDIDGYSGCLILIPSVNFGMFYAANVSDLDFSEDLTIAVIRRFFPENVTSADATPLSAPTASLVIPEDIEGFYRFNQISRKTAEKIVQLNADQVSVSREDGAIVTSHTKRPDIPKKRWAPHSATSGDARADLYVALSGETHIGREYLYFQRDEAGRVTALVQNEVNRTYDKLEPYEGQKWQTILLCAFLGIGAVSILGTLMGTTLNKGKLPWEKGIRSATELWVLSLLFCCIQASFIVGLLIANRYVGQEFAVFVPYQVKALFVIPLAGGLLLAWFWFRLLGNLLNPEHHWAEKFVLIVLASGETLYMLFLANWRLLGFMF